MDEFLIEIENRKDEFYRYIFRSVWDSSVADDVFSSAVLAAYKSKDKFTPGTNFRAWMYKIITNICFVANREIKRRGVNIDDIEDDLISLHDNDNYTNAIDDPEEFLESCGDEVYTAIRTLSAMERSCLLLKVMCQFSYKELAQILEIPFGTVMTHLARGRAKLRLELLDYAIEIGVIKEKTIKFKRGIS
jgi:RNA polymerase sigma-70 factor, ECF subfamily